MKSINYLIDQLHQGNVIIANNHNDVISTQNCSRVIKVGQLLTHNNRFY